MVHILCSNFNKIKSIKGHLETSREAHVLRMCNMQSYLQCVTGRSFTSSGSDAWQQWREGESTAKVQHHHAKKPPLVLYREWQVLQKWKNKNSFQNYAMTLKTCFRQMNCIQQGPSQFSSDYKQGSDSFWPMNLHNMNFQSFVITAYIFTLHS